MHNCDRVAPPPRTCSSLKNHFSAPNNRTEMKLFVYDPNSSNNEWTYFQVFLLQNNGRKKYKNLVWMVGYKQDWSTKIIKKIEELCL